MQQVIRSDQDKIIFYRKWLRIAFEQDRPPEWVDDKYFKRFRAYPLEGWKLNAIYSNPTPEQRAEVKAYFTRHSFRRSDPSQWRFKQLSLEFGHEGDRKIEEFDPSTLKEYDEPEEDDQDPPQARVSKVITEAALSQEGLSQLGSFTWDATAIAVARSASS
jgi:hypothetical protein